jgi:hypothetical protein
VLKLIKISLWLSFPFNLIAALALAKPVSVAGNGLIFCVNGQDFDGLGQYRKAAQA